MRSGRKSESAASRRARQEFTESVLARGVCEIQDLIPHECGGGWVDACHILPKKFIRVETNLWAEPEALAAMWNTDNALRGCRTGHSLFDAPGHGVQWWQLPAPAIEFAEGYGWLWRLEREYPELEDRVVA